MNNPASSQRVFPYRIAILALSAALAALWLSPWVQEDWKDWRRSRAEEPAPYYKEIQKIFKHTRYSAFPALMRPDVKLKIDFEKRSWSLDNMHRFDPRGRALLDEGRYGACGQLAAYVHQEIQPLFDHRYSIRLVKAAEAGFFPPPGGTHLVLRITDLSSPFNLKTYILDPSFRRYGPVEGFEDYLFYDEMTYLSFITRRGRDEVHPIGSATPILMKRQVLVGMVVQDAGGRFDRDNFSLALTATRKHRFTSKLLVAVRKRVGKTETYEDPQLGREILGEKDYQRLRERLLDFFRAVEAVS